MHRDPIDLRSDTLTKPGPAIRNAMVDGDAGDDCFGENTSVRELEAYCADLFGKESAVLMPSGTMSNQVALKSFVDRGQEVLCDTSYHINFFEASPSSDLGGAAINAIDTPDGVLTPELADQAVEHRARWSAVYAETRLLWLENSINGRGGRVFPLEVMARSKDWAERRGTSVFLDGARIMNAVAATGVPPCDWGRVTDAMSLCFAKGLGAPMGSVLMGTSEFIGRARHFRKWYGGALHQSGPIAAAALWALRHNAERLADDHHCASVFAAALAEYELLAVTEPETSIVIFDVGLLDCTPPEFVEAAAAAGVRLLVWRGCEVRAVFSLTNRVDDGVVAAHRLIDVAASFGPAAPDTAPVDAPRREATLLRDGVLTA